MPCHIYIFEPKILLRKTKYLKKAKIFDHNLIINFITSQFMTSKKIL